MSAEVQQQGNTSHEKFTLSAPLVERTDGLHTSFYGGLEGVVGSPQPDIARACEEEHTEADDSLSEFVCAHYDITTTSQAEWRFVATPDAGEAWAREKAALPEGAKPRSPLSREELRQRIRQCNGRMTEHVAPLTEIEAVCARLYSGPMWCKYTAALRGYGPGFGDLRDNTYVSRLARPLACSRAHTRTCHASLGRSPALVPTRG